MSYLEGRNLTLRKHDLSKEPPSRTLLSRLIDQYGVEKVLNPKSPAFKARGLDIAAVTKKMALDLIEEEPNLLKRPLILRGDDAIFGFNAEIYEQEFA